MITKYRVNSITFPEELSVDNVKNYLKITTNVDDGLILSFIKTATTFAREQTGILVFNADVSLEISNCSFKNAIEIKKFVPIIEVYEVKDKSDSLTTPINFNHSVIVFDNSFNFVGKNLVIDFSCGENLSSISLNYPDILSAILCHIGYMYENRSSNHAVPANVVQNYFKYKKINF